MSAFAVCLTLPSDLLSVFPVTSLTLLFQLSNDSGPSISPWGHLLPTRHEGIDPCLCRLLLLPVFYMQAVPPARTLPASTASAGREGVRTLMKSTRATATTLPCSAEPSLQPKRAAQLDKHDLPLVNVLVFPDYFLPCLEIISKRAFSVISPETEVKLSILYPLSSFSSFLKSDCYCSPDLIIRGPQSLWFFIISVPSLCSDGHTSKLGLPALEKLHRAPGI